MSGLWFEVTAIAHKGEAEVRHVAGSNVYIRGAIDKMLVIQVPSGVDHATILGGVEHILEKEGMGDRGVFVVDEKIEVMKLEAVERHKAKVLEARHQQVKAARMQNAPTTEVKQ